MTPKPNDMLTKLKEECKILFYSARFWGALTSISLFLLTFGHNVPKEEWLTYFGLTFNIVYSIITFILFLYIKKEWKFSILASAGINFMIVTAAINLALHTAERSTSHPLIMAAILLTFVGIALFASADLFNAMLLLFFLESLFLFILYWLLDWSCSYFLILHVLSLILLSISYIRIIARLNSTESQLQSSKFKQLFAFIQNDQKLFWILVLSYSFTAMLFISNEFGMTSLLKPYLQPLALVEHYLLVKSYFASLIGSLLPGALMLDTGYLTPSASNSLVPLSNNLAMTGKKTEVSSVNAWARSRASYSSPISALRATNSTPFFNVGVRAANCSYYQSIINGAMCDISSSPISTLAFNPHNRGVSADFVADSRRADAIAASFPPVTSVSTSTLLLPDSSSVNSDLSGTRDYSSRADRTTPVTEIPAVRTTIPFDEWWTFLQNSHWTDIKIGFLPKHFRIQGIEYSPAHFHLTLTHSYLKQSLHLFLTSSLSTPRPESTFNEVTLSNKEYWAPDKIVNKIVIPQVRNLNFSLRYISENFSKISNSKLISNNIANTRSNYTSLSDFENETNEAISSSPAIDEFFATPKSRYKQRTGTTLCHGPEGALESYSQPLSAEIRGYAYKVLRDSLGIGTFQKAVEHSTVIDRTGESISTLDSDSIAAQKLVIRVNSIKPDFKTTIVKSNTW